ncbi:alternate-type signal peptide domain-containing protein [Nocardioides sp. R-C-SC26]|uniref:alternate-type signal peptide domain-containing protein n=1 Tax=Nocardioides sp. R-C-SC26 TaxID=2870414 RepID=UPI001E2B8D22|nr:alternate-type signal peptide domain-containing protein [Nocardioides sp. R-C-SC26]
MRHSLKGTVAIGGAAVLLVGGAGTVAFWTDTLSVPGITGINSGTMALTDTTSGGCASSGWVLDSAATPTGVAFDPATDRLVPGDVVTRSCTFTVAAAGEHLHATLTPTAPGATGTLSSALTVAGSFTSGGSPVTDVTEALDGATVTARISVTFVSSSGNTTQLRVADISDYTVALTQTHS